MNEAIDICVMLGGPSPEREVSLRSGAAVAGALREVGHRVTEVDPANGTFQLPPNVDVVFLALHGTYGRTARCNPSWMRLACRTPGAVLR